MSLQTYYRFSSQFFSRVPLKTAVKRGDSPTPPPLAKGFSSVLARGTLRFKIKRCYAALWAQ